MIYDTNDTLIHTGTGYRDTEYNKKQKYMIQMIQVQDTETLNVTRNRSTVMTPSEGFYGYDLF